MAREAGVGVEAAEEDSRRETVSRIGILSRKGMGEKGAWSLQRSFCVYGRRTF